MKPTDEKMERPRPDEQTDRPRPDEAHESPHPATGAPPAPVPEPGPWINTPLRAAGSWIFLTSLLLGIDGLYTFVDARKEAELKVRIIEESGYQRFKHEGRIMTRGEVIRMFRQEPYRKAVPHTVLAVLLLACVAVSFRRPFHSTVAALGLSSVGCVAASIIRATLPLEKVLLYAFVGLVLLLSIKASYRYHRWVRSVERAPG